MPESPSSPDLELAGLPPRRAAWEALRQVHDGRPLDLALDEFLAPLTGPDRRLAHELAAGVLRTAAVLDRELAPHVPRGLESVAWPIRHLLRLGVYQLAALDRVPPHAAVSTTVELAKHVGSKSAPGFVNAVLRRVAENPPRIVPGRGSHPGWLVTRWTTQFGPEGATRLQVWNDTKPHLVVQPARWSEAELTRRWAAVGIEMEPAPFGAGLLPNRSRPADLPGYDEGGFIVQDPAQRLVVDFFAVPEHSIVYDACASPGGKTILLGKHARLVVAGERKAPRVSRLVANLERAGSGREVPVLADAARPPVGEVDVFVLDVPCLGTGVLARHPEARWRKPGALSRLVQEGAAFLDAGATRVKVGGLLCFSTCSLESEENERQIEAFLARDGRFRRDPGPAPGGTLSPDGDLVLLPHRHGTDGAYAARLRRVT